MIREKKRVYVDVAGSNVTASSATLLAGTPCLVKNHPDEEWKIKIYSMYNDTSGSQYQRTRPYKVHNKTNTAQNFSFRYCEPIPEATTLLPVVS